MSALTKDVSEILRAIDFPSDSLPPAWAKRAPKVILALGALEPHHELRMAKAWGDEGLVLGSRRLIGLLNNNWGEKISSGSYDEVRRRCVRFLVAAGIVVKDPDDPGRAPNSPATGYALSPAFGRLIKSYKTRAWSKELALYRESQGSLRERLREERDRNSVPVTLPGGERLTLSPGAHNKLQAAIVQDFLPQFAAGCEMIYIADALSRQLYKNDALLTEAGLFALDHRQLPDIVALDRRRGWLLIIEAVATSGHLSPIRKLELKELLKTSNFPPVFVSAFPDYATFAGFAGDIAWETEVWIADHPTHLIHFNGERYLGPYEEKT